MQKRWDLTILYKDFDAPEFKRDTEALALAVENLK